MAMYTDLFILLYVAPADFTALVNVQVSLPIGTNPNTAPFCTPITIENDGIPENLETFSVLLSSGSPGIVVVDPTDASATVNIIGDSEQINYRNLYHLSIPFNAIFSS